VKGLGEGYSSPIIVNHRIYLTGDVGEELQVFCLDAADGKELWKAKAGASWKDPYPGARATAAYGAGRVHLQNAHGQIWSFDAATGKTSWMVDLLGKFGGNNITWGMSECLLVDERAVYATAGGREALVVALDKRTGDVLWKSPPLFDSAGDKPLENASYVSPILTRFGGRRLLLGCSLRNLFCMDADTGMVQWTRRVPTAYSVLAMMPVLVDDGIFMTAPHGKPGCFLQLLAPKDPGGKIGFEQKWETRLDTCQGGVVHHDGKLIGSYYPGRKGWAAVDARNGEVLYQAGDIVKGAVLYADGRLYVLSENGWMRLLEAGKDKFTTHGEFRLAAAASDAWAHPVILNQRLYLRYQQELVCYDVRAR
jgi:outer membrane protein assembly factor BamB